MYTLTSDVVLIALYKQSSIAILQIVGSGILAQHVPTNSEMRSRSSSPSFTQWMGTTLSSAYADACKTMKVFRVRAVSTSTQEPSAETFIWRGQRWTSGRSKEYKKLCPQMAQRCK